MIAQFIAYFNYTNMPTVAAIAMAEALERANIGALPLLVGLILVITLLTIIIPGVVPKWAIFAPVFYKGERLFYTLTRAHQADIGAPIPSSYLAFSKTIYEEGLQLPCMRIQRDYKNIEDIIRMCRVRIRVPEQW